MMEIPEWAKMHCAWCKREIAWNLDPSAGRRRLCYECSERECKRFMIAFAIFIMIVFPTLVIGFSIADGTQ